MKSIRFMCLIMLGSIFGCLDSHENTESMKNDLGLRLNTGTNIVQQGYVNFSVDLINNGRIDCILTEWNENVIASNFTIIGKGCNNEEFYFDYTCSSSSAYFSHVIIPSKSYVTFPLILICNFPPGKYTVWATLNERNDVKTKPHQLEVRKGSVIDVGKALRK